MSAVNDIVGTKVKLCYFYEPEKSGQIVTVKRAIVEPEAGIDDDILPLFEIKMKSGELQFVTPEELRSIDGAVIQDSMASIGGQPVKDIHPLVNRVIQEFSIAVAA